MRRRERRRGLHPAATCVAEFLTLMGIIGALYLGLHFAEALNALVIATKG